MCHKAHCKGTGDSNAGGNVHAIPQATIQGPAQTRAMKEWKMDWEEVKCNKEGDDQFGHVHVDGLPCLALSKEQGDEQGIIQTANFP